MEVLYLRACWRWISTVFSIWTLRLMTAHTRNQVTEPRSLPQFKRQSVPGVFHYPQYTPHTRSRGNGSAHFHRANYRAEPSHPHLLIWLSPPPLDPTTSSVLHLQGTFGCSPPISKIMCISFSDAAQKKPVGKDDIIYCVEIKLINSIITSYKCSLSVFLT